MVKVLCTITCACEKSNSKKDLISEISIIVAYGYCPMKVKVTVGFEYFSPFTQYKLSSALSQVFNMTGSCDKVCVFTGTKNQGTGVELRTVPDPRMVPEPRMVLSAEGYIHRASALVLLGFRSVRQKG